MSLVTQLSTLATRIATEFKSVRTSIGSLASLSTTAKSSLVAAINEVVSSIAGGGGASINDTSASTSTVYSSSKTEAVAAAAAADLIDDAAASTSSVYSSTKTNTVASAAGTAAASALISDTAPLTTKVYSSQKVEDAITAAISALVGGAPGALDTLKELADAIGDDASYAAGVTTALSNKLGFDVAQTLTAPQKVQGNTNLGSLSLVQSGDPTTDFVTVFEAALA